MEGKKFKKDDPDIYLELLLINEGAKSISKLEEHRSCPCCKKTIYQEYCIQLKCKHVFHRNCILYHMIEESKYECPECSLSDVSSESDIPYGYISSDEEETKIECIICFEDIEEGELSNCKTCKSKFHSACIEECKERDNIICPICHHKKRNELEDIDMLSYAESSYVEDTPIIE